MNDLHQTGLPNNLILLHDGEEQLRKKALDLIAADSRLVLHAQAIEAAMDMLDTLRQFPTEDEDVKVIQMLGIRSFNAFGASMKLALSGYSQNSALIMRDILETVFLVDLFRAERAAITRWRLADKKARMDEFRPARIRAALDKRDGFTGKRRDAAYDLFSGLAGHPNMQSVAMLRPKGLDAQTGPFIDSTALEAVMSEMGRLAIQVGEIFWAFFPNEWPGGAPTRAAFARARKDWLARFYPHGVAPEKGSSTPSRE